MKTFGRWFLVALLGIVAVGLIAPRVSANRFRPRIQSALESALNRPVHLGAVHLTLFTGPGFTVDNVLIDDDPAAGIEPFAHVESVEARIRWTSLVSGNLAFSSLRLDNPTVNVVKMPSGPWNIQPLLDRHPQPGAAHPAVVPDIQIRGGRIDFKFGDTKSVFYISDADVDVYPDENGEVVIRFSGAPARTDQASQSFGELSARGLFHSGANGENELSMGVHLDRTPIAELTRLFHGSDIGVHGYVLANAKLAGPLSKIGITGDVHISDLHRWDLMPAPGEGWALNYQGLLDLTAHHLELASVAPPSQPDPASVDFQLDDYLSAPKWSGNLRFHDLPAASVVETARHFGAPLPPDVQVDGAVEGRIGYASQSGASGQLMITRAAVKFPRGGSAQFSSAQVQICDGKIELAPSNLELSEGQSAQVQGEYSLDNSHAEFRVSTHLMTLSQSRDGAASGTARLLDAMPIPLLEHFDQGTWKGWVSYEKSGENPGVWSGQYDLQNAAIEIPGLASAVRIAAASVVMNGAGIQVNHLRGRTGPVKFEGDYRYEALAAHPHRLRLTIPDLQLADLQNVMLPALRRDEGFLARAFRRDQPLPKWLEDRDAEIGIQIASLMDGDSALGDINAHGVWRGATISLPAIEWHSEDMHASGKLTVNLTKAEPSYDLSGMIENFDYRNGQLDIDGELQTSGTGAALFTNLRSKGTFDGRGIMLAPETEVREVSGSYRVGPYYREPRLLLSDVQVVQGAETLLGQGASEPDGHIVLELASGRKQVRLTGMLLPVHPEPATAR